MKTLLRHLALLTLILTPLAASFENTQRSLLPANTNPRAPRQGLVFDGTAGATGTAVTIGTADLTFSQWVRVPSTVSETRGLFLFSPAGSIGATSLLGYVDSDATLNIHITGATSGDRTKQTLSGFVTSYAGKWVNILFTRVGSTWTGYINGVATTFSASTSGTAPTWAGSISGAVVNFGSLGSSGAIYNDAISAINIYNRALSASEVVALYETGAPAGADYNSASSTNLATSTITGSGTITGASATGFTLTAGVGAFASGRTNPSFSITKGTKYRVSFNYTRNSGTATNYVNLLTAGYADAAVGGSVTITSGANTVEFTASTSDSGAFVLFGNTNGAADDYTISGISVTRLGLLLAPDAAQAGGGLVWYDTSGNAANISWTSGVSWNVPSSQKTASGWTYGGNLTVSSSSAYLKLASTGSSNTWDLFSDSNGSFYLSQSGVLNALRVFPTTGNFSIGAGSTDGGQKLQVSGTIRSGSGSGETLSAGSIDVGADIGIASTQGIVQGGARIVTFTSGNATFGGNLTVSGTGTSSFGGDLTFATNKGIYSAVQNGRLYLSGDSAGAGAFLTLTGSSFSNPNNIRIDANTGTISNLANTKNSTWDINQNWAIAGNLTVSGTGTSSVAGNLGIGTTSPLGVLDVRSTTPDVLFNGKDTADPVLYFGRYQYDNVSKSGAAIKYVHGSAGGSQEYGRLAFLTATGSFGALTERMRINESGNLLIGTATDSANGKLQLATHTTSAGGIGFGTDWALHRVSSSYMGLTATGNTTGTLSIGNSTNPASASTGVILQLSGNDAYLWNYHGGTFYIGNNNGTALSFDSSRNATFAGQITASGISHKLGSGGTGSANALLTIDGSSASNYGSYIVLQRNSTNKWQFGTYSGINGGTSDDFLLYNPTAANEALKIAAATSNATFAGTVTTSTTNTSQNAGNGNKLISSGAVWVVNAATNDAFSYYNSSASAYRFYVDSGGTISATNTAISAISDARLKENIRDLSGGLSSILALKPRVFDWKEGKGANKKNVRGFIAQEIEQVFPDLVDEWKDAAPEGEAPYKSVRQDLIPVLVKAIQELKAEVDSLKAARN